jgi:NTP pyrophosphatase (non-canonical NTP hydrolase)
MVKRLAKNPALIVFEMNGRKAQLMHAILGISGEAGELLDTIKKHIVYNQPLDMENVVEELGDLEFYLEMLRQELKLNRQVILWKNESKLVKRYGKKYSDKSAKARKDKK